MVEARGFIVHRKAFSKSTRLLRMKKYGRGNNLPMQDKNEIFHEVKKKKCTTPMYIFF